MPACLCVRKSVCLSFHPAVYPPVCQYVCQLAWLYFCLYFCLSLCQSVCMSGLPFSTTVFDRCLCTGLDDPTLAKVTGYGSMHSLSRESCKWAHPDFLCLDSPSVLSAWDTQNRHYCREGCFCYDWWGRHVCHVMCYSSRPLQCGVKLIGDGKRNCVQVDFHTRQCLSRFSHKTISKWISTQENIKVEFNTRQYPSGFPLKRISKWISTQDNIQVDFHTRQLSENWHGINVEWKIKLDYISSEVWSEMQREINQTTPPCFRLCSW